MDLNPQSISKSTFQDVLTLYPVTVEARARHKATEKILSRKATSSKGKKPKAKPPPPPPPETNDSGLLTTDQQTQIQTEVDEFLSLDRFRYEDLPGLVAARAKDPCGGGYLEKDELVKLVEWKMKHGIFRPALLGLIRSNPEPLVRKVTGEAFAALHGTTQLDEGEEVFPAQAVDMLVKPLRGVGVATASLILSLATTEGGSGGVPFYSDDVYLWVCLGEYSPGLGGEAEARVQRGLYKRVNGELNVKYDVKEYRGLWQGVKGLQRLLGEASCLEVEKVALVVRYRGLEGVSGGGGDGGGGDGNDKQVSLEEGKGETKRGEKRALEQPGEDGSGSRRRRSKRLGRG
ncbi:hypothetical protein ASPCADRAFT_38149 [Aspergillus carbonarius ITEM 5010]|uniref:Uncharacterized protein n=1 Tax=Aspergillus carbonarius (strain ITEM 5010) TaxID=602072 RepID=A0A1R3S384_ASPC5|nr:hypothetical protein ASPCADRAFT_38149 [Aspergillus carbonarius ITEM 5010]